MFAQNVTFFTDNIIIDGKEQVLPVGTKKYKFEFEIPKDGHNSFTAPGASFSYMLRCTVDIPWGIDAEGTLELFVNEVKDLNDSIGPFFRSDGETFRIIFQRRSRL